MSVPVPEPNLRPEEMVQRAREMLPILRERQAECESLGRLPDQTSRDFIERGFYRILQPRRFGGYEFELPVFTRVAIELARGCPSSAWAFTLTAGHTHLLSAFFSEECQVDVYGQDGEVRMPGNFRPGRATPVDGGFNVSGAWDYVSGCDSATQLVLGASVPPELNGGQPYNFISIIDRKYVTIIDNWDVLGLRGTGSRRVVVEDVFVPAYRTIRSMVETDPRTAPGRQVHANPMYRAGSLGSLLFSETTSIAVGIARGALDIYEETITSRKTTVQPVIVMNEHPQYQRFYGEALALVDVAEGALLSSDRDYMEWSCRDVEEGIQFTPEMDRRLQLRKQFCSRLASQAMDLIFRTAGSSSAKTGAVLQRYYRDMAMLMTHNTAQPELASESYARFHFGFPPHGAEEGSRVPPVR